MYCYFMENKRSLEIDMNQVNSLAISKLNHIWALKTYMERRYHSVITSGGNVQVNQIAHWYTTVEHIVKCNKVTDLTLLL